MWLSRDGCESADVGGRVGDTGEEAAAGGGSAARREADLRPRGRIFAGAYQPGRETRRGGRRVKVAHSLISRFACAGHCQGRQHPARLGQLPRQAGQQRRHPTNQPLPRGRPNVLGLVCYVGPGLVLQRGTVGAKGVLRSPTQRRSIQSHCSHQSSVLTSAGWEQRRGFRRAERKDQEEESRRLMRHCWACVTRGASIGRGRKRGAVVAAFRNI